MQPVEAQLDVVLDLGDGTLVELADPGPVEPIEDVQRQFGLETPPAETVLEMAYSLIERGVIKKTDKYRLSHPA